MSRTLTEIYTAAKSKRDEYWQLTEFSNSSKMSILDAFTWVVSACVWTHENLLDVFKVDIAKDLQNRINGSSAYYVNAILKYQSGDSLVMSSDGTSFSYASVDETKRIVKRASYTEISEDNFYDKQLQIKVATGETGNYSKIDETELLKIQAYLNEISFAGTHGKVVSRIGDILIPRVTVYYDGSVSVDVMRENIQASLNNFIDNLEFDSTVYAQKVIDALQNTEHVTDVHIDFTTTPKQGIFVVQYDDNDAFIASETDSSGKATSYEKLIDRYIVTSSGYLKESSASNLEADVQTWSQAITLKLED